MRLRRGCSGAWIALLAAAADRATKALALRACGDGGPLGCSARPLVTGVLNLNVTRNTGVAFSGLSGRETLVIALALVVANTPVQSQTAGAAGFAASMLAGHAALGAIVVAILAFCLGVLVTVFCFRLRRQREEECDDRKP